jgi:hypothetical protein
MKTINYKGKEYPTRTFTVFYDGGEHIITIATESLSTAIGINDDYKGTLEPEEENIDQSIYFYVEDEVIGFSGDEICESHLDIQMELIEDHDESDEDTRYSIQDLDALNIEDLKHSMIHDELLGLIDEESGGIIGYFTTTHAKRIMDSLNSIKYLEANLRKLD